MHPQMALSIPRGELGQNEVWGITRPPLVVCPQRLVQAGSSLEVQGGEMLPPVC